MHSAFFRCEPGNKVGSDVETFHFNLYATSWRLRQSNVLYARSGFYYVDHNDGVAFSIDNQR